VPRWTTPDPLAEKYFPINTYAYCAGDPVNLVDPEGRFPVIVIPLIWAAADYLLQGVTNYISGDSLKDAFYNNIDVTSIVASGITGGLSKPLKFVRGIVIAADAIIDTTPQEGIKVNSPEIIAVNAFSSGASNKLNKILSKGNVKVSENIANNAEKKYVKLTNIFRSSPSSKNANRLVMAKELADATRVEANHKKIMYKTKPILQATIKVTNKAINNELEKNDESN
jgi:hypothetical protein